MFARANKEAILVQSSKRSLAFASFASSEHLFARPWPWLCSSVFTGSMLFWNIGLGVAARHLSVMRARESLLLFR
jgi:hypothetical protein